MKIAQLIFISIFFILLLFSITTYINFNQYKEVRDNAEYLSTSASIIRQGNRFQRNILYMERGLRGYLITGDSLFIQTYDSAIIENKDILKDLFLLVPNNSVQQKHLGDISILYYQWINNFAEPMQAAKEKRTQKKGGDTFEKIYTNKQTIEEEERIIRLLQDKFRALSNYEYDNREKQKVILARSEQQTKNISFSLTALSIIAGFIIAFILVRHISARIHTMVKLANTIADGNYGVQVVDKRNDELSELAKSLNYMATMLAGNISLLKRKNTELDQFAHIVSHDLKAPLRGIANVLTWIEEDHAKELTPKVAEYLQLINGRVARSENLIQGMLSYARIGKDVQAKEEVNVEELIKDILENLPVQRGITITVQQPMPVLFTEKIPLMQVFSNLISNALKYHNKEGGTINIYSKDSGSRCWFFVADNGPGIAAVYHEKIFKIFQTLTERDTFESTGVGLAIIKKIIEERNEEINIESEPGKGTTFSFTWLKA
jgi:signal transduction histidine kinase